MSITNGDYEIRCSVYTQLSGGSRISWTRGRQPQRWGRQPIILVNFPPKLHDNEKFWTQRGRMPGAPPPGSANAICGHVCRYYFLHEVGANYM